MAKKLIVHLRVYKGTNMAYDENRKPLNENQSVKIQHGTFEWNNFMKMATKNGYCKVEVEKVTEITGSFQDEKVVEVNDISAFVKEVKSFTSPEKEVVLTPDQKRIQDLEAKLEKLVNSGKQSKKDEKTDEELGGDDEAKKKDVVDAKDANDYPVDPEALRVYFEELMGKKPHHKASDETLIEQMNEFKAKK